MIAAIGQPGLVTGFGSRISSTARAWARAAIWHARSTVSGVSQTRISTVPNSGLGRMSQYRS